MNKNLEFKMNVVLHGLLTLQGNDLAYPFQLAEIYNKEPNMEWYEEIKEKWKKVITEFKEKIKKDGKSWWSDRKIRGIAFSIKDKINPTKRN